MVSERPMSTSLPARWLARQDEPGWFRGLPFFLALTSREPRVRHIGPSCPKNRFLVNLTRQAPAPTLSPVLAARIVIPGTGLRLLPVLSKPVLWIQGPDRDSYSEVQVWFSNLTDEHERAALAYAGLELLARLELRSEHLLVSHRHRPIKPDHHTGMERARERVQEALAAHGEDSSQRGVTYFEEAQRDGSQVFVEMAFSSAAR